LQRAPDPGGTAVWTIPDFASLAEISLELGDTNLAVEPVAAGTYAPIGAEIL